MAYTTAFFTRLDQNTDGSVAMIITHTGDSGEPPREQRIPYEATVTPTADTIRAFAMDRQAVLNRTKNFITGALPFVNTQLDTTTPLPSAAASTFGAFIAVSVPFTPGSNPQDVFTITGSATRRVEVVKMAITTVQTTAGFNIWSIVKRSTANSGGTSAAVTKVPVDKAYPAATATVVQYTANATSFGTLVGGVWTGRIAAPTASALPTADIEKTVLNGTRSWPLVLTGTGDVLAWNFGAVALPAGLSVQASVWWTEI